MSAFHFWPWFSGTVVLLIGLVSYRREFFAAPARYKFVVLGPVFLASALATFGAEHLSGAQFLAELVPAWMPAHLFFAYLVGVALIATSLSLVFKQQVGLACTLLAVMIFSFVLLIHIPNIVANPRDRIFWAVGTRDALFAAGALAFAAIHQPGWRMELSRSLVVVARVWVGLTLIFFGVENCLHPLCAPGVPLAKLTPAWMPLPYLWALISGVVMAGGGVALVMNRRARDGAAAVGTWAALLTFLFYLPILLANHGPAQITESVNYVWDTMMFAGAVLLLAEAMPRNYSSSGSRT